jgi:hypothetical protein
MAGGFRIGKRARKVKDAEYRKPARGNRGREGAAWTRAHFPRLEERVCPWTALFSADLALGLEALGSTLCSRWRPGTWEAAGVSVFLEGSWLRRLAVIEGSGLDTAGPPCEKSTVASHGLPQSSAS